MTLSFMGRKYIQVCIPWHLKKLFPYFFSQGYGLSFFFGDEYDTIPHSLVYFRVKMAEKSSPGYHTVRMCFQVLREKCFYSELPVYSHTMNSVSIVKVCIGIFPSTPNEAQLLQINNLFTENTARSQNEQQLYTAWQKSELEKQQMYNANQNLQEELNVMKLEIERLKSILKPSETISQEDEISDNDLAEDMKWVQAENSKKKRKLADRKSLKQTMQNVTTVSTAATHMQPKQT
jgi:hypothetical protein